jgi:hypothetical protein
MERPPLTNISKSGTYLLRLCAPKDEKFKTNKRGFASVTVFFVDGDGNCLNKHFSAEFPQAIAMVVGKFSGKYIETPKFTLDLDGLKSFIAPAHNLKATCEIEVTPDGEWQGKPQFKYKFKTIKPFTPVGGSVRNDLPEAPPF